MDTAPLRAAAPPSVRFVERFVSEGEAAALFRRADLAVLPYREIEQSGVLFTALGFGVPLVLTDVGGFPEVAAAGAAELVPPGNAAALARRPRGPARRPGAPRHAGDGGAAPRRRGARLGRDRPRPPRALRLAAAVTAVAVVFWVAAGLLVYAQVGYPLLLEVLGRLLRGRRVAAAAPDGAEPSVSLVVAAHREAPIIAAKVANARALDWPRERLEVIVACDGSPDDTPARARAAGADVVLELPWGGKVRAQDAAVERARGDLLAFSDANALWEPGALRALAAAFADDRVGYACGQVRFLSDGGTNQEGLYWRYEMAIRARESQLQSVTAGNGAIYAVRPEAYLHVDPIMGHDLSLPFNLVKRGWRAVYAPAARAVEKMVPTIEGEFARKRRMMSHAWPIVLRGGLLVAARLPAALRAHGRLAPAAALRDALPAPRRAGGQRGAAGRGLGLRRHLRAPGRACSRRRSSRARCRCAPLLVARYYVLTTASMAAGLWDYLRHGTPAGWAPPEGTR